MARKKFDKARSTTFQLVHRPQNDPRIHDEASSSALFKELAPSQSHKIKSRHDLESELFSDTGLSDGTPHIRHNEGEAAGHGIYFDDTEYDYMQHIRDLDSSSGEYESFFVEAKNQNNDKKGKNKMSLEEALREASLRESESESGASRAEKLFGEDMALSKDSKQASYQDQQDVPDALVGFQPDMDPRLREVLEALDDEDYIDDEEDFFARIAEGGEEVTQQDFQRTSFPEDGSHDGWESDATEKPAGGIFISDLPVPAIAVDEPMSNAPRPPSTDHGDGVWMKEFRKFKHDQKSTAGQSKPIAGGDVQSSILTGASALTAGRWKKRKGAMTNSTGYSMTSSSLARTEGLRLLDARFSKIAEDYAEDDDIDMDVDDSVSMFSKNSMASKASHLSRTSGLPDRRGPPSLAPDFASQGFGDMMDEFHRTNPGIGSNKCGEGRKQRGMSQLDEIRRELGPARVRAQKTK